MNIMLAQECSHVNISVCSYVIHESSGIAGKKLKGQAGKPDSGGLCAEARDQPGNAHAPRKRISEHNDRDSGTDRESFKM